MAKNILDDEVLKRNSRFISERESDRTEVTISNEATKSEFQVLYDKDAEKGIEEPKREIEINLNDSANRTPTEREFETPEIKKERTEIEEGNSELTYNQIYDNNFWSGALRSEGRASNPGDPIDEKTINTSDLEIREKEQGNPIQRQLAIFLYLLFPYIGTSTVANIRGAASDPDIIGLAVSASQNAYFLLQNLRYFTPFELGKYFLHNFYTLHFMKEMTVKYPPGRFPSGAPDAENWNGRPDIFFGQSSSAIFYLKQLHNLGNLFRAPREDLGDGSQFLTQYKDAGEEIEGSNFNFSQGSTEALSPKISINPTKNISKRKTSPTGILQATNSFVNESNFFLVSVPNLQLQNGKWKIDIYNDERENFEGTNGYCK